MPTKKAPKFNVVSNEDGPESVTAFVKGRTLVATKGNAQFANIVSTLQRAMIENESITDEQLIEMFDQSATLARKFIRLSERVMVRNGHIYFDGEEVNSALTSAIVRFHSEGNENFLPLVCFMEKVYQNPQPHSIEHLFRWAAQHRFGLAPDGDLIAFKGVDRREDIFMSKSSGTAIVNGEIVTGKIPNIPGAIIEMPRGEVTFDPRQGCNTGLHVGNWRFAREFGPHVLQVKINPRDVVSVPTDSNEEKMRVCRYRIIGEIQHEPRDMFYPAIDKTPRIDVPAAAAIVNAPKGRPTSASTAPDPVTPAITPDAPPAPPAAAKPRPKKRAKTKAAPEPVVFPDYYEQYQRKHWDATPFKELQTVAKSIFEIKVTAPVDRKKLTMALMREAKKRLATWPEDER